ncbi:MAG: hypothetical protein A2513_11425 [Sulfurimonas sp. RIFOXYD12_FULL_33_39]|uniref:OmpA family protein n=1 Tax=unclassified Sulfurimonas TaxID=2623549 RepID=UPI0008C4082B|nr:MULTISPECIES: OmpA family protein [unclassified Sulfurimonas]OHE03007.1 MAG: hypothetical protein A3G74_06370 [Sulfurimonas sp. RIFCSPLOWO2_12_FULL_34_6]OHE09907.1 MAG: hypothetical protein A2513_11425 [Sulfurimonas sp. RIFOXYD12_FULL_33_39]OHE13585.1 MAG: hypothetical protein A2530_08330 [Sulfurimonas sp. RIFOXYD2_FULL_34_21]DAB28823.1 MAG TPA: cell envelope biogenesis protein OmpA [Sulfurimonas sp. UBA10385]
MKKLLLIPAILAGSMAFAQDYKYEITPVVGYNVAEGNIEIDNQTLYGAELQYNDVNTFLKPELSVLYTDADYDNSTISTDIYRIAINGVKEFSSMGIFTPLAKIGVGYETIDTRLAGNRDGMFLNAGVGAKIPFSDAIALKLEALYMLKNNHSNMDSNLALLAGLNFAFGPKSQPQPEPTPAPQQKPVDGDDDKDGVLNSVDKCPNTKAGAKVDANGCEIALAKVIETQAKACPPKINLHINFKFDSAVIDEESKPRVVKFSEFLKCSKEYKAEIIGHTDSVGTDAYNQKLSQRRADAVRNEIVKDGVDANRVTTSAKGESEPIATNKTREGRAENRRIEAQLSK